MSSCAPCVIVKVGARLVQIGQSMVANMLAMENGPLVSAQCADGACSKIHGHIGGPNEHMDNESKWARR